MISSGNRFPAICIIDARESIYKLRGFPIGEIG